MNYIGIDPGYSGAIAIIYEDGAISTIKLNETLADIVEWMGNHTLNRCFAMLEQVHAMPGQGVASTFKFGRSYGNAEALLAAFRVPFDRITPVKWQTALQCRSKGNKNITKARAQELFPDVKCTHAISDALLLAEYGKRKGEG